MKSPTILQRANPREVVIHVLFWLLILSMINVNWTDKWLDRSLRPNRPAQLSLLFFALFFYLNAFYLLPRFFNSSRWWLYMLATGAVFSSFELTRALLTTWAFPLTPTFSESLWLELQSADSIIFAPVSPLWLGLLFSCGYRFTKDWLVNHRKIERLETEKKAMELHLLKAHINPHFLFNSLNTLDELIDLDTRQAKAYLQKLSRIYRYLLTTANNDWVSVKEEWRFVEDYIFLMEERFGRAYQFRKTADFSSDSKAVLPPASLQSLLENAVKHNIGNPENPLLILIEFSEKAVTVQHEKRLKTGKENSLGTGLKNLKTRFSLLTDKSVQIEDSKNSFLVRLPLSEQLDSAAN